MTTVKQLVSNGVPVNKAKSSQVPKGSKPDPLKLMRPMTDVIPQVNVSKASPAKNKTYNKKNNYSIN